MNLIVLKCDWLQCKSSRTLALPAEWTLSELHDALQAAFGWNYEHMYCFEAQDGTRWEMDSPFADFADFDGGDENRNSAETTLGEAFPQVKSRLDYEYDFGDSNEVRIVRQKDVVGNGPACLKASGLMAEEDSAAFGYADGIASILEEGPEHEMYDELADWFGIENEDDVERWIAVHTADAAAITKKLARIKPARQKKKRGKK